MLSSRALPGREVIEGFREKSLVVEILQGYGLTESMEITKSMDSTKESRRYGIVGLLSSNREARIVDPEIDISLPNFFNILILFFKNIFWSMEWFSPDPLQSMGYRGRAKRPTYINDYNFSAMCCLFIKSNGLVHGL